MANIKLEDIIYLISSSDIYLKRQWDTAHCGPAYANSMDIKYLYIMSVNDFHGIFIIDTVLNEEECFFIEEKINNYKSSLFIFKIIDPYFEYEKEKYFFKLLFRLARKQNVFFISNLHPTEVTLELDTFTNHRKLLFLPYPYQQAKEIEVLYQDFIRRKYQICYSGAVNPLIYPNRSIFIKKWKRNPLLWNRVEHLRHPGYKDQGNKVIHNIAGNEYIKYLAQYKTMFCDSSKLNLEFVKFGECAYAHCIPFGEAPASFSEEMKKCFIQIDYQNFYNSIKKIYSISSKEQYELSKQYRIAFKRERSKVLLQSQLLDFINKIYKAN